MISRPTGGRDAAFAANLEALTRAPDARQALAVLRRAGVGGPVRFDAIRVLDRVAPRGASEWDLAAYELVATLFGVYHQGRTSTASSDTDLGGSFARLAARPGWTDDRAGRRLAQILAADAATLPERLRRAITLLRSEEIAIDWARLARDVRDWSREERPVQRHWARSFVADRPSAFEPAGKSTASEGELP